MSDDDISDELGQLSLADLEHRICDVRNRANAAEVRDDFEEEDRERMLLRQLKKARSNLKRATTQLEIGCKNVRGGTDTEEEKREDSVASLPAVVIPITNELESDREAHSNEIIDEDPLEVRHQIRAMRNQLRIILNLEERARTDETLSQEEKDILQNKPKLVYNLMKATQRLQQLGYQVERESRLTQAEMNARNARRNGNTTQRPQGGLQLIRHELQQIAAMTQEGIFGDANLTKNKLQKLLNVSFCFFLFLGFFIGPIILVYYSLSTVQLSDNTQVNLLLYLIAELVFGFCACSCFMICSGCCVLGSGHDFTNQHANTTARLGWCAWFFNLSIGIAAVIIPVYIFSNYPELVSALGASLNITIAVGVIVSVSGVYILLWNCCLNPASMNSWKQHANSEGRSTACESTSVIEIEMRVNTRV